jgi:glycosyltransferase involved in cell wall biosynthesis
VRVLHIIPGLAGKAGGPVFATVESALSLRPLGVDATILATDLPGAAVGRDRNPIAPEAVPNGAAELDVRLFRVRPPARLAFSPGLARAASDLVGDADVVHIHSLYLFPQFAGWACARWSNTPYIVTLHGALDPWLRRHGRLRKAVADVVWQHRMLARSAELHVTTGTEARQTADVAPRVPRAIVPYGIDWARFQRPLDCVEFRQRRLGGEEGPVVLNLGRMAAKKGLDVLIRAFAALGDTGPPPRLVLAGPDDEGLRPALERLAAELGVDERVTFTGMLHGDERLEALAAADVWALPSHTENFGIAVAEAMAAGRAVVISPGVSLAPDVEAADAGVVAVAEPQAFAGALAVLLADEERRRELGERARAFARRYDWERVAPEWKAMYERAAHV